MAGRKRRERGIFSHKETPTPIMAAGILTAHDAFGTLARRQKSGSADPVRAWREPKPAPRVTFLFYPQIYLSAMLFEKTFTRIANRVAHAAGTPAAFILCCLV